MYRNINIYMLFSNVIFQLLQLPMRHEISENNWQYRISVEFTECFCVSENGSSVQQLTLPDTITEWVGKAVCVHPTAGLGLSPTASITTFTPFFIDLTILPTVKKGEIMPVKISVFNYLETSLPVSNWCAHFTLWHINDIGKLRILCYSMVFFIKKFITLNSTLIIICF